MTTLIIGMFFGGLLTGALVALADKLREPNQLTCHCFICEPCKLRRLAVEKSDYES